MKEEGAVIFLPELEMSIEALRLHLSNIYNIKLEQMNHKMQTGGTADSAMSNDPMIGGTAESSMKRGGRIEQGDYVKVKPQYGDISGEVTFATDNIIVIKNAMGKTYMFHPNDLVHQMSKGGKLGIGDTVYISDDKSMFKGQSGTILSQLTPSTFLVKILVDGNERNVVVRKSGVEHIENLEGGGLMTSDDVYSYDTQEPMMAKGGGDVEDSGLYVIGRTQIDNNAIKDVIEEEGFHAEWNARGGYWFFPEEVDNYDELENQLSTIFDKQGINARFEGIFKKGGRFDSIFNKAKELSKKGYEKSKAYTKQKVKDAQRKVAVDVLNTTQNKVGTRDKDVLDKARVLVINKYQKGGTLVELEKQIPVFERQHIKGYKAYYDAKKRLEAAEKKHNNTMQSKRIIDNYTTLMIKAKKTYSDNIKKELEGKAEGYIGDKKMAKGGATPSQKKKVGKVMHEWKAGKLHSGSKKGPVVKSQEQAVAIALSEAGLAKKAEKGYVIKKDRFGTSIKVAKKGYTQVMGVNGPRFIKNQPKGWKHKKR
jgi:hypothetical protein